MSLSELLSDKNMLHLILGVVSFALVVIFWIGLIEDNSADRRIKLLERRRSDLRDALAQTRGREAKALAKNVAEKLNLVQGEQARGTAIELAQAGFRSKDAIFVYMFIRLALPLIGFALGFFLFFVLHVWDTVKNNQLAATLGCGIVLGLLPTMVLRHLKKKRVRQMLKSLPDALDLFVICAEAGLSLDATFERVSQEIADAHPDLADEFGLTAVELGFMPERARALQGLADRCPLPGVSALVSTLVQTERYGTPLAVAMRVLSAELRNERMMKAEEKAARLPATMTVPMILFILPPLFVVLLGPAVIKALDAFNK